MVRVNGITLHRGSNKEHHSKPLMWFSDDKNVAEKYANHLPDGKVVSNTVSKSLWLVNIGDLESSIKPIDLFAHIVNQSDVQLYNVHNKAYALRQELEKYNGTIDKRTVLYKLKDVFVDALELFECDGFQAYESGKTTYGILLGKVLCCMK